MAGGHKRCRNLGRLYTVSVGPPQSVRDVAGLLSLLAHRLLLESVKTEPNSLGKPRSPRTVKVVQAMRLAEDGQAA
jgi:hypothetical protein